MSTMAAQQDYYEDEAPPREEVPQREEAPASTLRAAAEKFLGAKEAAIVPADSISGRALLAVIAIMTFLAALTLGAVVLVRSAAGEWQSAVAREVTIQVRPSEQRDIEADVNAAVAIASGTAGVAAARAYSKEESAGLLEPWLGNGLSLNDLPIPRMIVVRVAPGEAPDLAALRQKLAAQIPGVSLDDHRGWVERMRAMARNASLAGLAVLALVLAATMLSVMFATRGAMSTNRQIIEVLHVIGARRDFIAGEFQRHFLLLGLKGGALGGGVAIVLFALIGLMSDWLTGGAEDNLFGNLSLGAAGYGAIIGLVVLVAGVTAGMSRLTVQRTLQALD
ncbi:MAG: ABC transporter permease [Alphaproteobacteria bacterium]